MPAVRDLVRADHRDTAVEPAGLAARNQVAHMAADLEHIAAARAVVPGILIPPFVSAGYSSELAELVECWLFGLQARGFQLKKEVQSQA